MHDRGQHSCSAPATRNVGARLCCRALSGDSAAAFSAHSARAPRTKAPPSVRGEPRHASVCRYTAYNKPWTVMQWMKETRPVEEFILILDPDCLFRRPLLPADFGIVPGRPASFNAWRAPPRACAA